MSGGKSSDHNAVVPAEKHEKRVTARSEKPALPPIDPNDPWVNAKTMARAGAEAGGKIGAGIGWAVGVFTGSAVASTKGVELTSGIGRNAFEVIGQAIGGGIGGTLDLMHRSRRSAAEVLKISKEQDPFADARPKARLPKADRHLALPAPEAEGRGARAAGSGPAAGPGPIVPGLALPILDTSVAGKGLLEMRSSEPDAMGRFVARFNSSDDKMRAIGGLDGGKLPFARNIDMALTTAYGRGRQVAARMDANPRRGTVDAHRSEAFRDSFALLWVAREHGSLDHNFAETVSDLRTINAFVQNSPQSYTAPAIDETRRAVRHLVDNGGIRILADIELADTAKRIAEATTLKHDREAKSLVGDMGRLRAAGGELPAAEHDSFAGRYREALNRTMVRGEVTLDRAAATLSRFNPPMRSFEPRVIEIEPNKGGREGR